MPDIVAADADDDEIVAGAPDRLQGREEITDARSVARAVMDRDLRDIVRELAGEGIFRPVGSGTDGRAVTQDEYFFEWVAMLYGKGSRSIG